MIAKLFTWVMQGICALGCIFSMQCVVLGWAFEGMPLPYIPMFVFYAGVFAFMFWLFGDLLDDLL